MKQKTAMHQLHEKLVEEVKNLEHPEQSEYIKGYQEALNSIAKDIVAQMAKIEMDQMIDFAKYARTSNPKLYKSYYVGKYGSQVLRSN